MQKFDWGSESANMQHYNQTYPPTINIDKLTGKVPVAMFVGTADDFGDTTDAEWAEEQIKPVWYSEFPAGHASFMIGKNMTYVDDVLSLLSKYNSNPE
jgi:gastric triacylglycerol lipase